MSSRKHGGGTAAATRRTAARTYQMTDDMFSDDSSSDYGDDCILLDPDLSNYLVTRTEARIDRTLKRSVYVRADCSVEKLPEFSRSQLRMGPLIASGGFSRVYAIESFEKGGKLSQERESGQKSFVLKALNPKIAFNTHHLQCGARDLVKEAYFLSSLNHENIIKPRGWSRSGLNGWAASGRVDGFFLIYDRLTCTLFDKLHVWDKEVSGTSRNDFRDGMCPATREVFNERIDAVLQLSKALAYMHKRRMVHMDLKPGNVGFDSNGVVKLFDFGVATELPLSNNPNQTYALSSYTGTPRFMSPEVILKQPLNCQTDVYSFAIVLWEVLSLEEPYSGYSSAKVKKLVSLSDVRPRVPYTWPKDVKKLLKKAWTRKIASRPKMDKLVRKLSGLLVNPTSKDHQEQKSSIFRIRLREMSL